MPNMTVPRVDLESPSFRAGRRQRSTKVDVGLTTLGGRELAAGGGARTDSARRWVGHNWADPATFWSSSRAQLSSKNSPSLMGTSSSGPASTISLATSEMPSLVALS